MIPIFRMVDPALEGVKAKIMSMATAESPFVTGLAEYAFASRGQMLRPRMVLSCSMLGGAEAPGPMAISLAAMVELIHCASLLHDDVVDGARVRRKVVTVNEKWGNKEAVLLGDFILSMALELLSDWPDSRVVKSGSRITHTLAVGQLVELEHERDLALAEAKYLEIIGFKTAGFFAECCYLGGLAAGLEAEDLERLSRAGHAIGMAYQIVDDLLDLTGSSSGLGKETVQDMVNGNITLPIIYTLSERAPAVAREKLQRLLDAGDVAELRQCLTELVQDAGGYEYARQRAESFARDAARGFDALPATCSRTVVRAMHDFPEYLFARLTTGGDAARAAGLVEAGGGRSA